jgi:hypothetical protein
MNAARWTSLLVLAALAGCSRPAPAPAPARHHHHPPHAGTAVVLGDEAYHLELVLDPARGTLDAFVLDGEMENFVRCSDRSFVITARAAGASRDLTLAAVANPETGETVGDTAQFEAAADWLRGVYAFDGTVRSITIRGTTFNGVAFKFPKGNDADD